VRSPAQAAALLSFRREVHQPHQEEFPMSTTPSSPLASNRVGFAGFQAYGDVPGVHGPWKTYDGRDMPTWDAVGPATQARWVVAGEAERRVVLEQVKDFGQAGAVIAAVIQGRTLTPGEQAMLNSLMTPPSERVPVVPTGQKPSAGREQLLEQFRTAVRKDIATASTPHNGRNTASFTLRYYAKESPELAFDFMRICSEELGEPLDERGVWKYGAEGELWLPEALTLRAEATKSGGETSAAT
jgi:hypothetical protein